MSKAKISFKEINNKLRIYKKERGWVDQDSADLAKSILIEAAELLEHYQWDNTDFNNEGVIKKKDMEKVAAEIADIFIYLLGFCQENEIDLLAVTMKKLQHNIEKYPADQMKHGDSTTYMKIKKAYRKNS